jgi:hypothetical protein
MADAPKEGLSMQSHIDHTRRQLTHDERKAAEAAFQGRQFNNAWAKSALDVYIGIRLAMMKAGHDTLTEKIHSVDHHWLCSAEDHQSMLA